MTNTTVIQDIFIPQGVDWEQLFDIPDNIDLTGGGAALMIRTVDGATFIATLTPANSGLVINPDAMTVLAKLTHAQTAAMVPGEYVYDLKVSTSANIYYRPYEGNAIIDAQVTYIDPVSSAGIALTTETGDDITDENGTPITT